MSSTSLKNLWGKTLAKIFQKQFLRILYVFPIFKSARFST
eukprot:UN13271